MPPVHIDPYIAAAVVAATALSDAISVLFTAAVAARRAAPAATWSGVWYLISSFAVISYTSHWFYVIFAAAGSWIGAYLSIKFLNRPARRPAGMK